MGTSAYDQSSTPASNTTVAGIGIQEGCPPSSINDAMRGMVAQYRGTVVSVTASGTDTYTATLAPAPDALTDGMTVQIRFTNANATTTPTLNINSLGAKTITKNGGAALVAGDIPAGHDAILRYVLAATTWQLLNPKGLASGGGALSGAINEAQGSDIASATTTDIGAATGNYVKVTGTTTITGLGTVQAGTRRVVEFTGVLTLTHNATSLILPGAANITTAAGDVATFVSEGSGNWRCTGYTRAATPPDPFSTNFAHFREEQTSGTAAAETSLTSSAWTKRTLNTTKTNLISGVSLASSQITLPAGTYFVDGASCIYNSTATGSSAVKSRLRNVTDGADLVAGQNENIPAQLIGARSRAVGRFTLAAQKVCELQTWVNHGAGTIIGGPVTSSGSVEVYSELLIWKIA